MSQVKGSWSDLYKKEDWWAIWLAMGIIVAGLIFFYGGSSIKNIAVSPSQAGKVKVEVPPGAPEVKHEGWYAGSQLGSQFGAKWPWYLAQFALWLAIFTVSCRFMGLNLKQFVPGFIVLYLLSLAIYVFSSWDTAHRYNLEAPLVALLLGLVVSNLFKLPKWLDTSFRTEYYIKTGIILLGATLPFTLIIMAGPWAFFQATIVSVTTFTTIYLVATRVFKLDPRFGAVMGAGGSVCGVSASIAVGGAVEAKKEHVAIAISLVTIFAIIMIFLLPIVSKALKLDAGIAGAWIGTSEFADAAGFAAAQAIGSEKAVRAFTLMKVIGRDIWIGLWSFALAIIAVVVWDKKERGEAKVSVMEIWWRFPKFVLGFFAASIIISLVSLGYTEGEAFSKVLKPELIAPIKTLRTWTFIFTFLSIGFTTRFRELTKFGWQPLAAFFAGVLINVPLGFVLSNYVFVEKWLSIPVK